MRYLLPWLIATIAVVLGLSAPQARADGLYHEIISRDSIRISDQPCTHRDVVRYLGGEDLTKWFTAYAHRYGISHNACWTLVQVEREGEQVAAVRLVQDNGRALLMPAEAFSPAPRA